MDDMQRTGLKTMTDVRAAIDDVDRRIVPLLLERLSYIEAAGHIKQDRSRVRDEARIQDVLEKVTATAESHSGNSKYITEVYEFLIEYSITHEFTVFDANS